MGAAVIDTDRLEIGKPAPTRFIHRVADVIPRHRALAANVAALRHVRSILKKYNELPGTPGQPAQFSMPPRQFQATYELSGPL